MARARSEAAVAAAQRAGQTVGAWVGEAIAEKIAREREPIDGDVLPPNGLAVMASPPAATGDPPVTIAMIGHAVEIAARLADLTGKPLRSNSRLAIMARRRLTTLLDMSD
jgi:hypothetical protein